jgi:hypothetical protein
MLGVLVGLGGSGGRFFLVNMSNMLTRPTNKRSRRAGSLEVVVIVELFDVVGVVFVFVFVVVFVVEVFVEELVLDVVVSLVGVDAAFVWFVFNGIEGEVEVVGALGGIGGAGTGTITGE